MIRGQSGFVSHCPEVVTDVIAISVGHPDLITGIAVFPIVIDHISGPVELPDGILLPGMFVRARVREGINNKAILIPQQAVTRDPKGNPTALVVNPNEVVELRMLKLDRAIGNQWLVSDGLISGDNVICEGMQRIRPGSTVKAFPLTTGQKSADKTEKGSSKGQDRKDGGS